MRPGAIGIQFYREIAAQAQSETDMLLVAELAREIGRRDLAVILGEAAAAKGFAEFTALAFPHIDHPDGDRLDDGPRNRAAGKPVRAERRQPCRCARADAADAGHRARNRPASWA